MSAITECAVAVRYQGGTYIARAHGAKCVGTCSSSADLAARRAAGKHMRVVEEHVKVTALPCVRAGRYAFWAAVVKGGAA